MEYQRKYHGFNIKFSEYERHVQLRWLTETAFEAAAAVSWAARYPENGQSRNEKLEELEERGESGWGDVVLSECTAVSVHRIFIWNQSNSSVHPGAAKGDSSEWCQWYFAGLRTEAKIQPHGSGDLTFWLPPEWPRGSSNRFSRKWVRREYLLLFGWASHKTDRCDAVPLRFSLHRNRVCCLRIGGQPSEEIPRFKCTHRKSTSSERSALSGPSEEIGKHRKVMVWACSASGSVRSTVWTLGRSESVYPLCTCKFSLPIQTERLIRKLFERLQFLSKFKFLYLNKRVTIQRDQLKRFQVTFDGKGRHFSDLNAVIQFIVQNAIDRKRVRKKNLGLRRWWKGMDHHRVKVDQKCSKKFVSDSEILSLNTNETVSFVEPLPIIGIGIQFLCSWSIQSDVQ